MGASAVDDWRSENPSERLDLSGADLGRYELHWMEPVACDTGQCRFERCVSAGADLSEAWARRTKFIEADLSNCALFRTSLAGADLRDADLSNTNMYRCILRDAVLNDGTNFDGAWAAKVIWPDTNR